MDDEWLGHDAMRQQNRYNMSQSFMLWMWITRRQRRAVMLS